MKQMDLMGKEMPEELTRDGPTPNVILHVIIPEMWCEGDLTPHGKVPLPCDKPKNFGEDGQCRECYLEYLEDPEREDDMYCTSIKGEC